MGVHSAGSQPARRTESKVALTLPPRKKDQGGSNPVAAQNQGCVFVGGVVGGQGEEKKKENILFGSSAQAVLAAESSYNKGMCG